MTAAKPHRINPEKQISARPAIKIEKIKAQKNLFPDEKNNKGRSVTHTQGSTIKSISA